jgi:hypothetical protein
MIVGYISKVIVAVDLLIEFSSFLEVAYLEELASNTFKVVDSI